MHLYNQVILISEGSVGELDELIRKPSSNECLYMDLNDIGYNMTVRFCLKIQTAVPDTEVINTAFQKAVCAFRGINLKYRGGKWFLSDNLPRCVSVCAHEKDIENFPVTCFDYRQNTVALNLVDTKDGGKYLCFDFFHGAVDGVSALEFIYCFFDLLNSKSVPAPDPSLTDYHIVKQRTDSGHSPKLFPSCALTGALTDTSADGKGCSTVSSVTTPSTVFSVAALISEALSDCFDNTAVMIPVNIRRYYNTDSRFLCGNLALPLFLNIQKGQDSRQISDKIKEQVEQGTPLSRKTASFCGYRHIPAPLRRLIVRIYTKRLHHNKRYALSGLVSSVGTADTARLQSDGIHVTDMSIQMECLPNAAFTAVSIRFGDHIHTTLSRNERKMGSLASSTVEEHIRSVLTKYM